MTLLEKVDGGESARPGSDSRQSVSSSGELKTFPPLPVSSVRNRRGKGRETFDPYAVQIAAPDRDVHHQSFLQKLHTPPTDPNMP